MAAFTSGFAGIVQQGGQVEQLRLLDFAQNRRKAVLPLVVRLAQRMQVFKNKKCMFIDGVAMVGIAHHKCIHPMKFRQNQFQNSQRMHDAQGVGHFRSKQNAANSLPKRRAFGQTLRQHRQRIA